MSELNDLIHQPVRLQIMASLAALSKNEQLEFTALRDLLDLTDGNLGSHLKKLEEAGYIKIDKIFKNRKPITLICITASGKKAFEDHVQALNNILK